MPKPMTSNAQTPSPQTCLVTGCAGFVGSHLTAALLELGHTVVGVDNFFSGYEHNMKQFREHPGFHFHNRSITDPGLVTELSERHPGLAHCFHLAAIVSVPWSMHHPDETLGVNLDASIALHAEAVALDFSSFTFAGSAAEYGDLQTLPLTEDMADGARQLSPYGVAKYGFSAHVRDSGFGVSLRFFNIYGPRQDPTSPYSGVISRFIDRGLAGRPLTIFGDGGQSRDFIYVRDAVRSYLLAAGLDHTPCPAAPLSGIYNVATGAETTVLTLAEAVSTATNNAHGFDFGPERAGDIRHSVGDGARFATACAFGPEVGLDEGLRHTIEWARLQ